MAKNKISQDESLSRIRERLEKDSVVIGTSETMSSLRNNKVSEVYITNNCPEEVKEDLNHYANLNGVKIVELSIPNSELGSVCRKPFSISVLSIKK